MDAHGAWATALVVLSLPAGCVGGGDDDAGGAGAGGAADGAGLAAEVLSLPTWEVGHWWTYEADGDFGEATDVVTEDLGQDWRVDTTSPLGAFFDALSDVSLLGPQRKADLAGSQGDARVEFFRWPLVAGASWTTTWDGATRDITVVSVAAGVAALEAREAGSVRVRYSYDGAAGWFGALSFVDANGTVEFSSRLVDHGTGYSGTVARWSLETVAQASATFGAAPVSFGDDFVVPEGLTDLWLAATVECPSGTVAFGVAPQSPVMAATGGPGYGFAEQCPYSLQYEDIVEEAPAPGTWSYGFTGSSPQGEGRYDVLLLMRTFEEVRIGT